MAKICFPHYKCGQFTSLQQVVQYLKTNSSNLSIYLPKIVQYNICYGDILRESGIHKLIDRLTREAPELINGREALDGLRSWWQKEKELGPYDIQCYNIHDSIEILGYQFQGLQSVKAHVEKFSSDFYSRLNIYSPGKPNPLPEVHIGELYANYPRFDSSDFGDNRSYQNYFFRNAPITEEDMILFSKIPNSCNLCRVHERIPLELLPVLYYEGDGDYMLLASKKE